MPLEITRSFIQNRDGTYELFKCPKVEVESIAETYGRIEKQPVLRPLELKTFLKVGNSTEQGSMFSLHQLSPSLHLCPQCGPSFNTKLLLQGIFLLIEL